MEFRSEGRAMSPPLTWIRMQAGARKLKAESLDEAEEIAKGNPFISAIRVYEIRSM